MAKQVITDKPATAQTLRSRHTLNRAVRLTNMELELNNPQPLTFAVEQMNAFWNQKVGTLNAPAVGGGI